MFFTVATVLPALYIDKMLPVLGVASELALITKEMVLWSLPALMIRVINDNFKTFLQNQGLL